MPSEGTTTQRGYGSSHKQLRKQIAAHVATGNATCWRCTEPIHPNEEWDLGHDDDDRTRYRGPEHARRCNRAAAGRKKAALHNPTPATPPTDTSRRW